MIVIGIAGRMRTGKTTLAVELRNKLQLHGYNSVTIDSFAEELRWQVAKSLWPKMPAPSARFLLAERESENKETIRPLMQALGEAKRKIVSPDYWVNALAQNHANEKTQVLIVDDVRHKNEADWVLRNNGILIRLNANEKTLMDRGANPERLAHYSETAMTTPSIGETIYPHRVLTLDTGGLSPKGMLKALWRFVEEMITEEDEEE